MQQAPCSKQVKYSKVQRSAKTTIKVFAQPLGFVASVCGQSLVCNRSNPSKMNKKTNANVNNFSTNNRKRRCKKVSLPCSCQWSICFQPIDYLRQSYSDSVRITLINALHSNGFIPSKDQLVLAKTKAGIYGKEQQVSMKELLKLMDLNEGGKYLVTPLRTY